MQCTIPCAKQSRDYFTQKPNNNFTSDHIFCASDIDFLN